MQLVILLALLLCESLASAAPHEPASEPILGLSLITGSIALIALMAWLVAVRTIAALRSDARHESHSAILMQFDQAQTWHAVLWLVASACALHFGQWPQCVRYNLGMAKWPLVDDLLIVTPLFVSLLASWVIFHAVDRQLAVFAIQVGRQPQVRCLTTRQAIGLRIKHYLALPMLPLAALLAIEDCCRWLDPAAGEAWSAALMAPLLIAMVASFPLLLRVIWDAKPLAAGPLRDRLESVARAWQVAPRQVLVWRTNRTIVNAAVVGFFPRWRYVLLSDALVERYAIGDIAAIFAHELAHVRQRHLLKRAMVLLLPVAIWLAASHLFPEAFSACSVWLAQRGAFPADLQAPLLFPLAMAAYFVLVFAPFSRLLEHEADLLACRGPLTEGADDIVSLRERTQQYGAMLIAICADGRGSCSLLHPSIERRIAVLEKYGRDPSAGDTLERRTGLANRLACSLTAGSLAAALSAFWLQNGR